MHKYLEPPPAGNIHRGILQFFIFFLYLLQQELTTHISHGNLTLSPVIWPSFTIFVPCLYREISNYCLMHASHKIFIISQPRRWFWPSFDFDSFAKHFEFHSHSILTILHDIVTILPFDHLKHPADIEIVPHGFLNNLAENCDLIRK